MGQHTCGLWGEKRLDAWASVSPHMKWDSHTAVLTFSAITRTVSSLMILEGLSFLNTLSVEGRGNQQLQEGGPLTPQIHVYQPLPCSRTHHGSPLPLRGILTAAAADLFPF